MMSPAVVIGLVIGVVVPPPSAFSSTKLGPVERYVTPEEFDALRQEALGLGFRYVESGPLVRSSYHAWQHVG